eukprot:207776-Pleurochrysis_carterae.AAC.1
MAALASVVLLHLTVRPLGHMAAPIAVREDVKISRTCTWLAQKAMEDLGPTTNANAIHKSGLFSTKSHITEQFHCKFPHRFCVS